MALTNEDLLAISQLLDTKLDARLKPIENDIKSIRDEQVLMRDEQRRFRDEQALMRDEFSLMRDEQALIKEEQALIKEEQALIRNEQALIRDEQALIKDEQRKIRLIIENDILHAINILSENYVPAAKRYENAAEKMDSMQTDIDILKKVVAEHSEKLRKIS